MDKKFYLNGRPCTIARERSTNNAGGARGRAWFTVYDLHYADGVTPEWETISASIFNGKALCGCCSKRLNLTSKRGCDCEFIGGAYVTDESGTRVHDPSNGQCHKHYAEQAQFGANNEREDTMSQQTMWYDVFGNYVTAGEIVAAQKNVAEFLCGEWHEMYDGTDADVPSDYDFDTWAKQIIEQAAEGF